MKGLVIFATVCVLGALAVDINKNIQDDKKLVRGDLRSDVSDKGSSDSSDRMSKLRKFEGTWFGLGVAKEDKLFQGVTCLRTSVKLTNESAFTGECQALDANGKIIRGREVYILKSHGGDDDSSGVHERDETLKSDVSSDDKSDKSSSKKFITMKSKKTYDVVFEKTDLNVPEERKRTTMEVLAVGPSKDDMRFSLSCNRDKKVLCLISKDKQIDDDTFRQLADLAKSKECGTLVKIPQDNCSALDSASKDEKKKSFMDRE